MKTHPMAHPLTLSTRTRHAAGAKPARTSHDPHVSGLSQVRLRLPVSLAMQLKFAAQQPAFTAALSAFLDSTLVDVAHYPQLKLLCSNRRSPWLSAEDAWSLYERNWRFIECGQLETAERELIDRLIARFGAGVPFG